jgi:DNA-binding HxlR family transcriptional regulator
MEGSVENKNVRIIQSRYLTWAIAKKLSEKSMKKSGRHTVEAFCTAAQFQKMISGKYKLRILWGLKDGSRRYSEIRKGLLTGSIGTPEIAPRVLGRELNSLIDTGMILRKDHKVWPLKVEYKLTARGRSFIPVIAVMQRWGTRHLAEPETKEPG